MSEVKNDSRPRNWTNWARVFGSAAVTALMAVCFFGCVGKPPAAQAPPPPAVTVAHPVHQEVVEWDTYTGYLQAPESVNVAARVSGLIVGAPFAEGSIVKKGDVLFEIDDRPFKADLDAKLADQQKSEATQANALITFNRLNGLRKDNAVSQQDFDNAQAAINQADADVAASKAAVESSRLNLEWCKVLSPINGRVSNMLVTVGNLVNGGQGQATLLTTVQSVTPMYCYVDIDENSVLKYQRLVSQKKLINPRDGKLPCYVALANETGFPHEGSIDFVDNHVDPTTGTLQERGVLDNELGILLPGFFARLCIPGSDKYSTFLIPDSAIGNDQSEKIVMVVNKDNVVEVRVVKPGALFGGLRSIVSGLTPEDNVIINGQMHARPGAPVAPTPGTISVDEATLSDPGATIAPTVPTTEAASPANNSNSAPAADHSASGTTGSKP
jgi:RND family efflux transporter MFP subunit